MRFARGGPTQLRKRFLYGVERILQILLKAGHYRPASETPFHWRIDNDPTLNACLVFFQGFRTGTAKERYCDFPGGGTPASLLDPRMRIMGQCRRFRYLSHQQAAAKAQASLHMYILTASALAAHKHEVWR